ncbi:nitrate ABC transporter permease [Asticcacaulis sp. YBE204]|uniref:nitrate ABC transporter permease n=1 Tax=Asticcacaulis sp. YBE204 TaxID=1282363 RepID=UPI0003C3FAC9|nr:nitrate ABC transporter permease [Asticcacaulis sp. YBE204]ESQ78343.1 bicarbonate ABC transporter permease [Asticcacaulis sp. YBE204]
MPFEVQKMTAAPISEPATDPVATQAEKLLAAAQAKQIAASKRRKIADKAGNILMPLLTIGVLLAVWEGLGQAFPGGLPSPSMVLLEAQELIFNPFYDRGGVDKGLFWHVLTSLSRVGIGFGLAAVCGVLLGSFLGTVEWARKGTDPIIQVLRTVPPLAWLPISLAALREAQPSALFVIFITSIWPIVINTMVGVRNIPQDYVNVAKVLRLTPAEYFFKIMLPAATPHIFTGLRIGVGMSWLAIVASEMLLGGVGIGFFIWDQYNSSRMSDIIVALLWVGMVGFVLDRLVALLGQYVSRGTAAD